jgi:hypothetical protein
MDRVRNYYNNNRLKLQFLSYIVGWRALEAVANDYQKGTEQIYQDARKKRSTTLPRDQAQARVVSLAGQLLRTVAEEKKKLNDERRQLETLEKAAA